MPIYFAYGANMDIEAMRLRCPASSPLGVARLMNHRFFIMRDGVASVRRWTGSVVHGLLWDLALADVRPLDRFEDVAAGRYRKVVQPVVKALGTARALVYVGHTIEEGPARPGYLEAVVASAKAIGLPELYVRTLAAGVPVSARGTLGAADGARVASWPGLGSSAAHGAPALDRAVPSVTPRFATPFDRK